MERKDDQFGLLTSDSDFSDNRSWVTSVSLPYFRGSGKNIGLESSGSARDRLNSESLFRKGRFHLTILMGPSTSLPTDRQRLAWQQIIERGDAFWNELMEGIIAEFKIQRPARLHAFKLMCGNKGVTRELPQIKRIADMKKLIRPFEIYITNPDDPRQPAEVEFAFYATWFNGFRVRVRDGHFAGFRRSPFRKDPRDDQPQSHHPVLGPLVWYERAWYGNFRCEPFRRFIGIATRHSEFREDPEDYGSVGSTLHWDLARGDFEMRIYSPTTKPPTDAQVKVIERFKADEEQNVSRIAAAIYRDDYAKFYEERATWEWPHIDIELPPVKDPEGLCELMQLSSVNVFPRGSRSADLVFEMDCTWSDDERGVLWRDGKVIEVTTWDKFKPKKKARKKLGRKR